MVGVKLSKSTSKYSKWEHRLTKTDVPEDAPDQNSCLNDTQADIRAHNATAHGLNTGCPSMSGYSSSRLTVLVFANQLI